MNDTGPAPSNAAVQADTTIFALLHAANSLQSRLDEALGRASLSMPKYAVLNELVNAGEAVSLGELATRLSCVKSNMTQLIDRLEGDGLVARVDDPADRRAVKAAITAKGAERHSVGAGEVARLHEQFAAATRPEDRTAMERLLTALE